MRTTLKTLSAAVLLALGSLGAAQAVTPVNGAIFVIQNRDAAGFGFNDPTVVAPVGGNPGTTLGAQRLAVYEYVAGLWQTAINNDLAAQSYVGNFKVIVSAGWEALPCTTSSAVLGSASAWNGWRDFVGAPRANTWYPQALANKLTKTTLSNEIDPGVDGDDHVDIRTQFNVNLGKSDCLSGSPFYLGLDGNTGGQVNFVTTLLHELGHGLGFSLFTTSSANGARFDGRPSVWEAQMIDNTTGKLWLNMSDAERVASAINTSKLAWAGSVATAAVPQVLGQGTHPQLLVGGSGAGAAGGIKQFGAADFGPPITTTGVSGNIGRLVDQPNGTGLACNALTAAQAAVVAGKVALVDRGGCGFVVKVKHLQNAGAKAVLVADNVVASISGLGGADPTITIPSVRILKTDGDAIKAALLKRLRGLPAPVVTATLSAPLTGLYAGADASNRPLLYAPNPREPGSSVSHWDRTATPNLLMEPSINADLTTSLTVPKDLTLPLLKDLGW